MTTKTKAAKNSTQAQDKPKVIPAFYIFETYIDDDGVEQSRRIGAAFRHKKGAGLNLVIGDHRLVAFPPKAKTEGVAA